MELKGSELARFMKDNDEVKVEHLNDKVNSSVSDFAPFTDEQERLYFSKMDKDIMKEWKKKRAALGKKMAKIAAKAKKDRAAAGEGADKVVGDSGAVKSARTSAEIRTFCNKTTTDLEARVQKITSELEEMQPNSRANEDHQTLKDRFDGVTKELSIAKEQSRTRAKVSGIRKLSVGQI